MSGLKMGWRDRILSEFINEVSRLTLVADPDALLTEAILVASLHKKGFDIIEYEDAISFRYAYETKYRALWDEGINTDLVVVLRTEEADLDNLPYDLYERGRKLSFGIKKLFPDLSYPIIEELDKKYFEKLYESQKLVTAQKKGDNATKDFILENVFAIKPALIKSTSQLLHLLLHIHYSEEILPKTLTLRIIDIVKKNTKFKEWQLEELFIEKNAFYEFLQERWPLFLNSFNGFGERGCSINSKNGVYNLKYPGPDHLPFGDDEVRIYIDNLFVEGILQPVSCQNCEKLKSTWVRYGIRDNTQEEFIGRITEQMSRLELSIPTSDSNHSEWLSFSFDYADLKSKIYSQNTSGFEAPSSIKDKFSELSIIINRQFSEWLINHYNGLINLPPIPPVTLNQILRYLQRNIEKEPSTKIALIVIDGLSLNQWNTIKRVLEYQNPRIKFDENSIFAWIPTLTSVSRQTIFSGKIPYYFAENINSTSGEPKFWQNYWEDAGVRSHKISYIKNLQDENISEYLKNEFNPQNTIISGFVINKIDNIMHGMQLGEEGMHNQIEQWTKTGYLNELLSNLFENGFNIWITSDHGNIESKGIGSPSERSLSDFKGERVRVFNDPILRSNIAKKYDSLIEWNTPGLPNKYFPLFTQGNLSFEKLGEKSISHGGISIDEVIVPFISITRGENH